MTVLQLRDRTRRWWEASTNVLLQTGSQITWEVFQLPSYYILFSWDDKI